MSLSLTIAVHNRTHPANLPILQPDLDSMRMKSRICQNFTHHSTSLLPAPLILFLHNIDANTGFNCIPAPSIINSCHNIQIIHISPKNDQSNRTNGINIILREDKSI